MSRDWKRRELRWTDESGAERPPSRWRVKLAPSPAAVPRSQRLVEIYDPEPHLVAVLADFDGGALPLLIARGSAPEPMMMFLDGEVLVGAMRWLADDGTEMVGTLGDPQPDSLPMHCEFCPGTYVVAGSDLRDAMARRPSGRRAPRAPARRVS